MTREEFVCGMNIRGYNIDIGIDDYGQQYFFEYEDNDGVLQSIGCGAYNIGWMNDIEYYFNHKIKEDKSGYDKNNYGISLKEILDKYECDFETIMVRCTWEDNEEQYDELIGYCKYINGELIPLDGDSYSLDDLYIRYEYDINNDMLVVWERGEMIYD